MAILASSDSVAWRAAIITMAETLSLTVQSITRSSSRTEH